MNNAIILLRICRGQFYAWTILSRNFWEFQGISGAKTKFKEFQKNGISGI
jgi:hypothetical protein